MSDSEHTHDSPLGGVLFIDELDTAPKAEPKHERRDSEARENIYDDEKADIALEVVDTILLRMDLDIDLDIRTDSDEHIVLDITGPDAGRVIGRKGQTLAALQYLGNKIVSRRTKDRRHVILDSGDYLERHEASIEAIATREAKRVLKQGRMLSLRPMTPRDRRLVHQALKDVSGVSTRSDGREPYRRVQIIPND